MDPVSSAPALAGSRQSAPWLVVTVVVGLVAGILAAGAGSAGLPLALAAGVALFVAFLWRLQMALYVLLFTLPLDIYGRIVTEPIPVTVFQVVLLLALAAWAVHVTLEGREWYRPSVADAIGAALVLAALWSLPSSGDPGATLYSTVRVVFLWAFLSLFVNAIKTRRDLSRVFLLLVATSIPMALIGLAQQYVPGFDYGNVIEVHLDGIRRAAALFDDPNYYAGFLSVAFVAVLAMLVHERVRSRAIAMTAAATVLGVALIATFSRTGWVGIFVGLFVIVATAPAGRRWRLVAASVALVLVLAALLPATVTSRVESIAEFEDDSSLYTRWGMMLSTVEMLQDDWVFGTGLTAYDEVYADYRKPGVLISVYKPHQLPLALWAEMGVAGLMFEVIFVVALVAAMWRRRQDGWDVYETAALAGLATLLAQTLFQYYLYYEYLWLFVALCIVSARIAKTQSIQTGEVIPS